MKYNDIFSLILPHFTVILEDKVVKEWFSGPIFLPDYSKIAVFQKIFFQKVIEIYKDMSLY
jgi:hypothetical protein